MGQNQSSAPSQAEVSSALAVMEAVTQEDCPRWTKKKLKELMRAMKALGARSGKPTLIYRCDLEAALKKTGLKDTVEGEILDKAYTVLDLQGEGQVPYQEVMMSVAFLVQSPSVIDKLAFALELYDAGRPLPEEEKEEGWAEGEDEKQRGKGGREEEGEEEDEALYSQTDVRIILGSAMKMAGSLRGRPLPDQALEDLLGMTFPLTHTADTNSSSPTAMQWQPCVSTEARFAEEEAREVQAGFISAGNDTAEALPLHPFDSAEKGQMGDDMGEDEGLLPGQSYKTAREIILSLKTYQIMSE